MLQTLLFIFTVIKMTNCQDLQPDEQNDFSITVTENVTGQAGLCIRVICFFTVPQSVSEPIRRTWFKGDLQNTTVEIPYFRSSARDFPYECSFMINSLVPGESDGEYKLKIEWEREKVYVFPPTVKIIVKELTQKPIINVPLLTVGEKAKISCEVPGTCINPSGSVDVVWTGIEPDEIHTELSGVPGWFKQLFTLIFHPEPEDHNTNLSCTVTLQKNIQTEATVTLKVRHTPKILNRSQCLVWGDELTCMCVSSGFPLPNINWPILDGATEYRSAFLLRNTIIISNISIPNFRNVNDTIECVSKNVIGTTQKKIQVLNHAEKQEESWSWRDSWIIFTLSIVLNIILASCLTVIQWKRKNHKKPEDDNHVYMTPLKKEDSVYEAIKTSSEN